MKQITWLRLWSAMVLGGSLAMVSNVQAMPLDYATQLKASQTQYHTPEDFFNSLPFISSIPRSFIFGDGFKVHLDLKELQIDHIATHSSAPVEKRQCMIGLSYMAPVAGFFTTRLDVPLMNAKSPALSDWGMSSLGDYVVKLSRTPVDSPSIRLVATARF